jgi:4-methylaminobutanoate oxidase (formaldehyde-forming)
MSKRIVVIGGGVIGTSIAWRLARSGAGAVTLIERDRLGSGTTWHSAGNITWKASPGHDEPVLHAYRTIEQIEKDTGQATGWLWTGRTFLARSRATRESFEGFDRVARARGYTARWLDPLEAKALNPLLDAGSLEGIWLSPLSGRLNPSDLTMAYAAGARAHGARIIEHRHVLEILTHGGRITGVRTDDGSLEADTVIVAAGLWSRALLKPFGIALAQWPCEHMYLIADMNPRLSREVPSFVAPDCLIYGREEVGGLLVGFFDEDAITIDPESLPEPFAFTLFEPRHDKIAGYFEQAMQIFPALASAPIRRFINGPEAFTPDGLPLIGRIEGIDDLCVACAMNSAGVTWSAMAGSIIADVVADIEPGFEAKRYDPNRFGSKGADRAWLEQQIAGIVSSGYRKQNR